MQLVLSRPWRVSWDAIIAKIHDKELKRQLYSIRPPIVSQALLVDNNEYIR